MLSTRQRIMMPTTQLIANYRSYDGDNHAVVHQHRARLMAELKKRADQGDPLARDFISAGK